MAANNSIIPAQRFSFADNQNIIPSTDFYSADFADVLNGQIPGSNTATSSLSNLAGILNTQTPGTNAVGSSLNGVSMVSNGISGALSGTVGAVGMVVNSVGQVVNGVVGTICGIADNVLNDAFSIVNTAIGGATGIVGSVFGSLTTAMPVLNSLSSNCLSGLFNGPLGITGPLNGLCGSLNGYCGGGVLPSLVNSLTCTSGNSFSNGPYNPLLMSLQSNFLTNASSQALSSLGVNNLMSSLSQCQSNPFGLQTMNGFALNVMQQSPYSTALLDMGNVGGPLRTNLPNLGLMVPNTISQFTNNFTYPTQPFYNIGNSGLTSGSVNAPGIQNAFNAINPTWNLSNYDGIPSVSSMLGGGGTSVNDLSNTDTYNAYQMNNSNLPMSYTDISNSSNWGALNNQVANNGYNQTYLGMSSGTNNGTSYIQQLSTVNQILGGGSSGPTLNNVNTPSTSTTTTFGIGTTMVMGSNGALQPNVNVIQNTAPPANIAQASSIFGGASGSYRQPTLMQTLSQGVNNNSSLYGTPQATYARSSSVSGNSPQTLPGTVLINGSEGSSSNASNNTPLVITNNNLSPAQVALTSQQLFGSANNGSSNTRPSGLMATLSRGAQITSHYNPNRIVVPSNPQQVVTIPNNIF